MRYDPKAEGSRWLEPAREDRRWGAVGMAREVVAFVAGRLGGGRNR